MDEDLNDIQILKVLVREMTFSYVPLVLQNVGGDEGMTVSI